MKENVRVLLRNGTYCNLEAWQKLYGLQIGSDAIGKHFELTEYRFKKDLEDYGELIVSELLMRVADAVREVMGTPVIFNSFNRNRKKQLELIAAKMRAAKFSPHEVFLAADIDTNSVEQSRKLARVLKEVAAILGVKIRVGLDDYIKAGQTFVHFDVCPEYYAPGKPWHDQSHPLQWEKELSW